MIRQCLKKMITGYLHSDLLIELYYLRLFQLLRISFITLQKFRKDQHSYAWEDSPIFYLFLYTQHIFTGMYLIGFKIIQASGYYTSRELSQYLFFNKMNIINCSL